MPRGVRLPPSANPAGREGNNIQNPTTSRNGGSNGATVALDKPTAKDNPPGVRRSGRGQRPSVKVRENNELKVAAPDIEVDTVRPRATGKRKKSGASANDGPDSSRRRQESASVALAGVDQVAIFKGQVCLAEDEDEERESMKENDDVNNQNQKQSKMRGKRPTGDIRSRALVTDFNNPASINENFPFYSDKSKYGRRNVPKDLLNEYDSKLNKARCVSVWRRTSPRQQQIIIDQLKARKEKQKAEERERKEKEKKAKQAAREAEKERKEAQKKAEQLARVEERKRKKREAETLRRAQIREQAKKNPIATRHLNPEDAVQSSFSQQHLNRTSTKGRQRSGAPTAAKHMNDKVSRTAERKMLDAFYDATEKITPKEPNSTWLKHDHVLFTSCELPDAPRGNGGPSSRNTVNDPNYDAEKPLSMNVHCPSEQVFESLVANLLNSNHPIVEAKLQERLESMQRSNAQNNANTEDDDATPKAVKLTILTEKTSAREDSDRAIAETTQSTSALAAESSSAIEVIETDGVNNLFV